MLAELLQLVGVAQQGQHAIANEVRGGLIPRDQEQTQHDEEFVLRQLIAGFLGRHQRTDQIVPGFETPRLDDPAEIVVEFIGRTIGLLNLTGRDGGFKRPRAPIQTSV